MSEQLDPVFRCDSCQKIVRHTTLKKIGCCPSCGNKRVRNVTVLSDAEQTQLKDWGFGEFLKKFQEVPEDA